MANTEADNAEWDEHRRWLRNGTRCQCGNPDWPGHCPGPAACPCVRDEAEDEDEEDEAPCPRCDEMRGTECPEGCRDPACPTLPAA